ncbi:MAG TPA: ABC transporter permease [Gemmatimonadaceae bacterium]|nr:ABC transporter permease [Gemmatimonadaceae bacterium]
MESLRMLGQDLRLAARALARQKGWTAVVVLTLALGIGANSALFTIVNGVLLRPLPYPQPDHVLSLSDAQQGADMGVVPSDEYRAWKAGARTLSAVASYSSTELVDVQGDTPVLIDGSQVTASYFDVLGVAPSIGRVFTAAEDVKGGPPVIVLSDELWRTRFGGDRAIIGKKLTIGDQQKIVIGIMPPSFRGTRNARYWVPAALAQTDPPGVTFFYQVVARLRNGATLESARAELSTISARVVASRHVETGPAAPPPFITTPAVMTLHDRMFGAVRPALVILLAAVGVLLLIACSNVSNLFLARTARRQREFAIRGALGASRWRIVRYLLCESVLLAAVGGAIGLAVPWLVVGPLVRLSPAAVAHVDRIRVDGTVLAVTAAVTVCTAILFGLLPAIGAGRADVTSALSGGSTRTTAGSRQQAIRSVLVVAEFATALVLLTGAGLLGRSFVRATTVDPGFRAENLLSARFELPRARYPNARARQFFATIVERTRAIPGVRSVALGGVPPLDGVSFSTRHTDRTGHAVEFDDLLVGAGYFETLGLPITAGRAFDAADVTGVRRSVILSASLARMAFPGANPIGQTFGSGADAATVIGIVGDVHQRGLEQAPKATAYFAFADSGMTELGQYAALLVRTDGNDARVAAGVRAIARSMDGRLLPPDPRTVESTIADAAAPRKFNTLVLGAFAMLAATLAAIGLYGVLAYLVTDRTREIGIRIALGADRDRVLRLVMSQGVWLTTIGVALGLAGSAAAVRLLRSMLFGVGAYDLASFALAAAVLGGAALLACYLPARRATRVDPMITLRTE